MDIEHRLTFRADQAAQVQLRLIGITSVLGLNTVRIRESDPRWPGLLGWIDRLNPLDIRSALFTRQELDEAQAVGWLPDWHHGYPQPEDDYLSVTYDLSSYCTACGGGAEQIAPFRMRSEPKWGRRSLLQLNWVFGEYFVTPQLWERVFKPLGIDGREVLAARSLKPLSSVLQLVVQAVCDLAPDGLPFKDCEVCCRRRYLPVSDNFLPAVIAMDTPIAKSRQSFGSGRSHWRQVLCDQRLRQTLMREGVRGVSFRPCR